MSDPNEPIDYLRAAVRDMTAIGFTSTCEVQGGQIVITLCKGTNTRTITLPEDFQDADSDAVTEALKMPMEKARLELAKLDTPKPKRKAKKSKRGKRADNSHATRKIAKRKVKLVDASPELQDVVDDALEPVGP
jgi:hypothetical protein